MKDRLRRVCVFCGSSSGTEAVYGQTAAELGTLLAERGLGLVYGGGDVGLMGILADAVLARQGEVIGIIPEALKAREVAHLDLTELHVVDGMHERKRKMYRLADAFIALPGGMGTMDELFETLTWIQLGVHAKPCGLLNVAGYWDPLLAQLDRSVEHAFIRPEHRSLLVTSRDAGGLLDQLAEAELPELDKWISEAET